jgi:hypothetical protein
MIIKVSGLDRPPFAHDTILDAAQSRNHVPRRIVPPKRRKPPERHVQIPQDGRQEQTGAAHGTPGILFLAGFALIRRYDRSGRRRQ